MKNLSTLLKVTPASMRNAMSGAFKSWLPQATMNMSNKTLVDPVVTGAVVGDLSVEGSVSAAAAKFTTGAGAGKVLTSDADGDGSWEVASNGDVKADGTVPFTADVDMGGNYLTDAQNFPDMLSGGAGYHFDGVDDYVSVLNNANLNFGTGDFSIIINYTPLKIGVIQHIIKKGGAAKNYNVVQHSGNTLLFNIDDDVAKVSAASSTTVETGKNYVVACVADRSDNSQIYINGKPDGTPGDISAVVSIDDATKPYSIGIDSTDLSASPANIICNKSLFFNLALSADEVKAFSNGAAIPYKYIGASQTELVTNGGFDTDTWWSKGDLWTISSGAAHVDGTLDMGTATSLSHADTLIIGKRYRITFTISNYSQGNIDVWPQSTGVVYNSNGTHTEEFTCVNTSVGFNRGDSGGVTTTLDIDNVSITQIGCVLDLNPSGIGHNQWLDNSGNELHGTVSGALPTNTPTNHREKYIDLAVTGDTSFTLPAGYIINAIVLTSSGAIGGGIDIGTTDGGGEIVTAEAIAGAGTVLCTLVAGANYNTTGADDTIYITDADGTGWDSATVSVRVQMERIALD